MDRMPLDGASQRIADGDALQKARHGVRGRVATSGHQTGFEDNATIAVAPRPSPERGDAGVADLKQALPQLHITR